MRLFLRGCALASLLGVALLAVTGWWFMDAIGFMGLPLFPFGDRWTITRALNYQPPRCA